MQEPVASSSSDESPGEVDDENMNASLVMRLRKNKATIVTEFYFRYYFVGGVIHSITSITYNDF